MIGKKSGSSQMEGEPIMVCLKSSLGFLAAFGKIIPITLFLQVYP